jgi:hypothetical protein
MDGGQSHTVPTVPITIEIRLDDLLGEGVHCAHVVWGMLVSFGCVMTD